MPSNPNQTPAEPRGMIAKLTRQINETKAQLARTERERVEQKCMLRDANAHITELVRGAESQGRRIAELEAASESPPLTEERASEVPAPIVGDAPVPPGQVVPESPTPDVHRDRSSASGEANGKHADLAVGKDFSSGDGPLVAPPQDSGD